VCVTIVATLGRTSSLLAVDYFWQNAVGGAFDEPSNWLPNSPPGMQGPGSAADTVNFDLGAASSSPYLVTNVDGENDQLLVHNDSVHLALFLNYALLNAGGADPSFVVGAANGDAANVILSGASVSVLETDVTRIANVAGSSGAVTARGLQWTGGNLRVGHAGSGTLRIEDDAIVSSLNASLGHFSSATGTATVPDGGNWTTSGDLLVGRAGDGSLSINGGAVTNANASIASEPSGEGSAHVSGQSSSWTIYNTLTVGGAGDGQLSITAGTVANMDAVVGDLPASDGFVFVSGDGEWNTTGRLKIGGDTVGGTSGGSGLVRIDGGQLDVGDEILISPNGVLELQGGFLTPRSVTLQGTGRFNFTGGIFNLDQFNGDLVNQGGSLVPEEPGATAVVDGDYTQQSGRISFSILGAAANNLYNSLEVTGTATLGGDLVLSGATLYEPNANEVYTLIQANDIIGSFNNVASGERVANNRGTFVVHYGMGSPFDADHVVLTDFQLHPTADFDNDGDVDGADLTQWQGDFGVNTLSNADGDGDSDGADFLEWQQQLGSAATTAAAVPEPFAYSLTALALGCLMITSRRAWRSSSPSNKSLHWARWIDLA
jgi:T5SS/PEP-CTERM-associated repeat protein